MAFTSLKITYLKNTLEMVSKKFFKYDFLTVAKVIELCTCTMEIIVVEKDTLV